MSVCTSQRGEDFFYFKELHAICKCEISTMTINGTFLYPAIAAHRQNVYERMQFR